MSRTFAKQLASSPTHSLTAGRPIRTIALIPIFRKKNRWGASPRSNSGRPRSRTKGSRFTTRRVPSRWHRRRSIGSRPEPSVRGRRGLNQTKALVAKAVIRIHSCQAADHFSCGLPTEIVSNTRFLRHAPEHPAVKSRRTSEEACPSRSQVTK
jgi:hypothetical protein